MAGTLQFDEAQFREGAPTLRCSMKHHHVTEGELAEKAGIDPALVSDIVSGYAPMTPQLADVLEEEFGLPWSFWMGIDQRFDKAIQRYCQDSSTYLDCN